MLHFLLVLASQYRDHVVLSFMVGFYQIACMMVHLFLSGLVEVKWTNVFCSIFF